MPTRAPAAHRAHAADMTGSRRTSKLKAAQAAMKPQRLFLEAATASSSLSPVLAAQHGAQPSLSSDSVVSGGGGGPNNNNSISGGSNSSSNSRAGREGLADGAESSSQERTLPVASQPSAAKLALLSLTEDNRGFLNPEFPKEASSLSASASTSSNELTAKGREGAVPDGPSQPPWHAPAPTSRLTTAQRRAIAEAYATYASAHTPPPSRESLVRLLRAVQQSVGVSRSASSISVAAEGQEEGEEEELCGMAESGSGTCLAPAQRETADGRGSRGGTTFTLADALQLGERLAEQQAAAADGGNGRGDGARRDEGGSTPVAPSQAVDATPSPGKESGALPLVSTLSTTPASSHGVAAHGTAAGSLTSLLTASKMPPLTSSTTGQQPASRPSPPPPPPPLPPAAGAPQRTPPPENGGGRAGLTAAQVDAVPNHADERRAGGGGGGGGSRRRRVTSPPPPPVITTMHFRSTSTLGTSSHSSGHGEAEGEGALQRDAALRSYVVRKAFGELVEGRQPSSRPLLPLERLAEVLRVFELSLDSAALSRVCGDVRLGESGEVEGESIAFDEFSQVMEAGLQHPLRATSRRSTRTGSGEELEEPPAMFHLIRPGDGAATRGVFGSASRVSRMASLVEVEAPQTEQPPTQPPQQQQHPNGVPSNSGEGGVVSRATLAAVGRHRSASHSRSNSSIASLNRSCSDTDDAYPAVVAQDSATAALCREIRWRLRTAAHRAARAAAAGSTSSVEAAAALRSRRGKERDGAPPLANVSSSSVVSPASQELGTISTSLESSSCPPPYSSDTQLRQSYAKRHGRRLSSVSGREATARPLQSSSSSVLSPFASKLLLPLSVEQCPPGKDPLQPPVPSAAPIPNAFTQWQRDMVPPPAAGRWTAPHPYAVNVTASVASAAPGDAAQPRRPPRRRLSHLLPPARAAVGPPPPQPPPPPSYHLASALSPSPSRPRQRRQPTWQEVMTLSPYYATQKSGGSRVGGVYAHLAGATHTNRQRRRPSLSEGGPHRAPAMQQQQQQPSSTSRRPPAGPRAGRRRSSGSAPHGTTTTTTAAPSGESSTLSAHVEGTPVRTPSPAPPPAAPPSSLSPSPPRLSPPQTRAPPRAVSQGRGKVFVERYGTVHTSDHHHHHHHHHLHQYHHCHHQPPPPPPPPPLPHSGRGEAAVVVRRALVSSHTIPSPHHAPAMPLSVVSSPSPSAQPLLPAIAAELHPREWLLAALGELYVEHRALTQRLAALSTMAAAASVGCSVPALRNQKALSPPPPPGQSNTCSDGAQGGEAAAARAEGDRDVAVVCSPLSRLERLREAVECEAVLNDVSRLIHRYLAELAVSDAPLSDVAGPRTEAAVRREEEHLAYAIAEACQAAVLAAQQASVGTAPIGGTDAVLLAAAAAAAAASPSSRPPRAPHEATHGHPPPLTSVSPSPTKAGRSASPPLHEEEHAYGGGLRHSNEAGHRLVSTDSFDPATASLPDSTSAAYSVDYRARQSGDGGTDTVNSESSTPSRDSLRASTVPAGADSVRSRNTQRPQPTSVASLYGSSTSRLAPTEPPPVPAHGQARHSPPASSEAAAYIRGAIAAPNVDGADHTPSRGDSPSHSAAAARVASPTASSCGSGERSGAADPTVANTAAAAAPAAVTTPTMTATAVVSLLPSPSLVSAPSPLRASPYAPPMMRPRGSCSSTSGVTTIASGSSNAAAASSAAVAAVRGRHPAGSASPVSAATTSVSAHPVVPSTAAMMEAAADLYDDDSPTPKANIYLEWAVLQLEQRQRQQELQCDQQQQQQPFQRGSGVEAVAHASVSGSFSGRKKGVAISHTSVTSVHNAAAHPPSSNPPTTATTLTTNGSWTQSRLYYAPSTYARPPAGANRSTASSGRLLLNSMNASKHGSDSGLASILTERQSHISHTPLTVDGEPMRSTDYHSNDRGGSGVGLVDVSPALGYSAADRNALLRRSFAIAGGSRSHIGMLGQLHNTSFGSNSISQASRVSAPLEFMGSTTWSSAPLSRGGLQPFRSGHSSTIHRMARSSARQFGGADSQRSYTAFERTVSSIVPAGFSGSMFPQRDADGNVIDEND